MSLTDKQCRAARGWLGWSQEDLSQHCGVSRRAVADFERGVSVPHDRTLRDIRQAFENQGIELQFDGVVAVGVRTKPIVR
jgi:transcriptional regulator with XRE-family HTH domain